MIDNDLSGDSIEQLKLKRRELVLEKRGLTLAIREVKRIAVQRIKDFTLLTSPTKKRLVQIEKVQRDSDILPLQERLSEIQKQILEIDRIMLEHRNLD